MSVKTCWYAPILCADWEHINKVLGPYSPSNWCIYFRKELFEASTECKHFWQQLQMGNIVQQHFTDNGAQQEGTKNMTAALCHHSVIDAFQDCLWSHASLAQHQNRSAKTLKFATSATMACTEPIAPARGKDSCQCWQILIVVKNSKAWAGSYNITRTFAYQLDAHMSGNCCEGLH